MTPFRHRLLRLIAVCTVLLLSLTACSMIPAELFVPQEPAETETSARQTEPETTGSIPTEPDTTIPGTTAPQETEPRETVPPETEPIRIDYKNLVTDAYSYVYSDAYSGYFCYHIPQVNLESCASVNNEISRTLSQIIDKNVHKSIREYGFPTCGNIIYVWNHKDDVISILVQIQDAEIDDTTFSTYYLSAQTGTRLDSSDLLEAFGLDKDAFHEQVKTALTSYWSRLLEGDWYRDSKELEEMALDLRKQTLADENIATAVPFINRDGSLAFTVTVYVPAGAGVYVYVFDYKSGAELYDFTCQEDHSADLPAADNGTLEYFIENCDRRYFSADEVSGFDKDELVYARNAIYAKSGRIFSSEDISRYFRQFSWYVPSIPADAFTEDMLNPYQIANRDLILSIENGTTADGQVSLEYFIENCDREYFTLADIQGFDAEMCLYARNAVFAKSGWIFSNQDLSDYFHSCSWYTPRYTAEEFSDSLLNQYQIANRDLILEYEGTL